jgi:hypothetical protein
MPVQALPQEAYARVDFPQPFLAVGVLGVLGTVTLRRCRTYRSQ